MISDYEEKSLKKIEESIRIGKWSNQGLVELIKLSGEYLNLKTITDYCQQTGMSYPGAIKNTKNRKNINLFNAKFIIDNN